MTVDAIDPVDWAGVRGADLRRDGRFALHCTVEDTQGGGGEVLVTGVASEVEAPDDFARRGWIMFTSASASPVGPLPGGRRPAAGQAVEPMSRSRATRT